MIRPQIKEENTVTTNQSQKTFAHYEDNQRLKSQYNSKSALLTRLNNPNEQARQYQSLLIRPNQFIESTMPQEPTFSLHLNQIKEDDLAKLNSTLIHKNTFKKQKKTYYLQMPKFQDPHQIKRNSTVQTSYENNQMFKADQPEEPIVLYSQQMYKSKQIISHSNDTQPSSVYGQQGHQYRDKPYRNKSENSQTTLSNKKVAFAKKKVSKGWFAGEWRQLDNDMTGSFKARPSFASDSLFQTKFAVNEYEKEKQQYFGKRHHQAQSMDALIDAKNNLLANAMVTQKHKPDSSAILQNLAKNKILSEHSPDATIKFSNALLAQRYEQSNHSIHTAPISDTTPFVNFQQFKKSAKNFRKHLMDNRIQSTLNESADISLINNNEKIVFDLSRKPSFQPLQQTLFSNLTKKEEVNIFVKQYQTLTKVDKKTQNSSSILLPQSNPYTNIELTISNQVAEIKNQVTKFAATNLYNYQDQDEPIAKPSEQHRGQKSLQELRNELFNLSKNPNSQPQSAYQDLIEKQNMLRKLSPNERKQRLQQIQASKQDREMKKRLLQLTKLKVIQDLKHREEQDVVLFNQMVKEAINKVDRNVMKMFGRQDDPERKRLWLENYLTKHSDRTDVQSQITSDINFDFEEEVVLQKKKSMLASGKSFYAAGGLEEDKFYLKTVVNNAIIDHRSMLRQKSSKFQSPRNFHRSQASQTRFVVTEVDIEKLERQALVKNIVNNIVSDDEQDDQEQLVWKEKRQIIRSSSEISSPAKSTGRRAGVSKLVKEAVKQLEFTEQLEAKTENIDLQKAQNIFNQEFKGKQEIQLPLPNKVSNKTLALKGYTLSIGQCTALAKVFKEAHLKIKTLFLDNCGVDDEEFACLLEGLQNTPEFTSLYYKANEFGQESLKNLKPILLKPQTETLLSLRLVNCQTSPQIVTELLTRLSEDAFYLESLGLIQMNVNEAQLEIVAKIITMNDNLKDLDLSWNGLIAKDLKKFIQVVGKNRSLQSLNLSYNQLIDLVDQTKKGNYVKEVITVFFKNQMEQKLAQSKQDALEQADKSSFVAKCFSSFVRYNTRIQHLDLTHTGLSEYVLIQIVTDLTKAKSLLSLHLNSNPGINPRVIDYYQKHLKCKPQMKAKPFHIKFKTNVDEQGFDSLMKQRQDIEVAKLKKVKNKLKYMTFQDIEMPSEQVLGITRVLGHKQEMPGIGQWVLRKRSDDPCWYSDFWNYCLVFWNEEIGNFNESNGVQIGDKKQKVINVLKRDKPDFLNEAAVPMLFTESTNWNGNKFFKLLDYIKLYSQPPDFTKVIENVVKNEIKMNPNESNNTDYILKIRTRVKQEYTQRWENKILENWMEEIRLKQKYKKPYLINFRKVLNPKTTFVLPVFLRPGRNHFIIRGCQRSKSSLNGTTATIVDGFPVYYNRHIVDVRSESIPQFAKTLVSADKQRIFTLQASVFKKWKLDTPKLITKCLKHDTRFWKVKKLVKDEDEYAKVICIIEDNFSLLKEMFVVYAAYDKNFPTQDQHTFKKFCKNAGILDKVMKWRVVMIYFKATNYEIEDQEGNDDLQLVRFEFFEMLLRIARGRYVETGEHSTLAEAFSYLLEKKIQPLHDKLVAGDFKMSLLDHWRETQLWNWDVSDLLESNLSGIQQVYDSLRTKTGKKRINIETMQSFIISTCKLGLSNRKIATNFALSKMTCANENEDGSFDYYNMCFEEFLEFICRLSEEKFQETSQSKQPLKKKIEHVLDILLKQVGLTIQKPNNMLATVESDSDNDY